MNAGLSIFKHTQTHAHTCTHTHTHTHAHTHTQITLTLFGDLAVSAQQDVFNWGVKDEAYVLQKALSGKKRHVLIIYLDYFGIICALIPIQACIGKLLTLLHMVTHHFYTQGAI